MKDIFYRLLDEPKNETKFLSEMNNLRKYANGCLEKISKSYKCTCWLFDETFGLISKIKTIKKNVQVVPVN